MRLPSAAKRFCIQFVSWPWPWGVKQAAFPAAATAFTAFRRMSGSTPVPSTMATVQ